MKKLTFTVLASVASIFVFAEVVKVSIVADKQDCVYKCGEETVFMITARNKDGLLATNGNLRVTMDNFGGEKVSDSKFNLAQGNPVFVRGALKDPGFLAATCFYSEGVSGKTKVTKFSTAYEPEKIKQGVAKPADFDAFWDNAVKKLDETVPLDPKMEKMEKRSTKAYTVYRVSFATANNQRVYGYLSIPTDKSKAPYPLRVTVPGAGCAGWSNNPMTSATDICLFMTVFPFEPDTNLDVVVPKYNALNKSLNEKYKCGRCFSAGISESREAYFYYPVILGINRAVNWVAMRDDVDKKIVTYSGTSQGGGFGFYLMGLNKNFTKGCSFVPAITDLLAYKDRKRQNGWPQLPENHPKEVRANVEKNAPYFDAANFASRIKIPIRVLVGFSDMTCAPGAVYAGYNAIPSKDKKIYHGIGMGHSVRGDFYESFNRWLK